MSIFAFILAAAVANAPVPPGSTVAIDTTEANTWIGSTIEVQAWNRPDVSVDQEVTGGNEDEVHAAVTRNGTAVTVTAQYTGERKSYFFGLLHSNSSKSFRWIVHVPAGRAVRVRETNGRIDVRGVTAALDLDTTNGRIAIAGAGPAISAHTDNGSIDATMTSLAGGAPKIALSSTNGGVRLHVPRGFTTRVEAHTANGDVKNPLHDGTGPGTVSVDTTNGEIEITVGS